MVAVRPTFHPPALLAKQAANIDRISERTAVAQRRVVVVGVRSAACTACRSISTTIATRARREWLDVVDGAVARAGLLARGHATTPSTRRVLEPKPVARSRVRRSTPAASRPRPRTLIAAKCDAWLTHGDPPDVVAPQDRRHARAARGARAAADAFGIGRLRDRPRHRGGGAARGRADHRRRQSAHGLRELPGMDRRTRSSSSGSAWRTIRSRTAACAPAWSARPSRSRSGCSRSRSAGRRSPAAAVQPAARGDGALRRRGDSARQRQPSA